MAVMLTVEGKWKALSRNRKRSSLGHRHSEKVAGGTTFHDTVKRCTKVNFCRRQLGR